MIDRAYLDHNATAPLRPEARAALLAALDDTGNASSVHAEGRRARGRIAAARAEVAALAGMPAAGVVFTSGATEALALALSPTLLPPGSAVAPQVLLASAAEHPAVLRGHRFPPGALDILPVDGAGRLDLAALGEALARHRAQGRRALLAMMAANNETGVVQDIAGAVAIAREFDAVVVCDAVQAAGRVDLAALVAGVDAVCLSAHKIGGPQGAGALVLAHSDTRLGPLLCGGGQELGRRAGTENGPAIAGFGAAASVARATFAAEALRLADLRDRMEQDVRASLPGAVVLGDAAPRLSNTSLIAFPGVRAETLVIALDLAHISVSAGAACASGKVGASHVLAAMGVAPDLAAGAIRLSLGWTSTAEHVTRAVTALQRLVPQLAERSSAA